MTVPCTPHGFLGVFSWAVPSPSATQICLDELVLLFSIKVVAAPIAAIAYAQKYYEDTFYDRCATAVDPPAIIKPTPAIDAVDTK